MNFAAIWEALKGKKTYILASLGLFIAILGHFFGPIQVNGTIVVPQFTWFNIYQIALNSGLFASLRHALQTSVDVTPAQP